MKRSPQTELRIVAAALLVVAAGLLVTILAVAPSYHAIFSQPWQRTFVSEADFQFYRIGFCQLLFTLFPLIAVLHVWAAWQLLATAKRVQNMAANQAD